MAQASIYVRIGSNYVRFMRNTEYKEVNSNTQATAFTNRAAAVKACKAAKIKDFKLVSTGVAKRF